MAIQYTIVAVTLNPDGSAAVSLRATDGSGANITVVGAAAIAMCYVGRIVNAVFTFP